MKYHPLCEMFPLMEGREFDDLVADIKRSGLREPILTISEGNETFILDGRNRFRACEVAGVKPRFEEYKGACPEAFVFSRNITRRHLTKKERALLLAELLKRMGDGAKVSTMAEEAGISQSTLYEAMAVSTVPEVKEAVQAGDVTLEEGAAIARDPKLKAAVESGDLSAEEAAVKAEEKTTAKREKAAAEGVATPKGRSLDLTAERLRALDELKPTNVKEAMAAFGMDNKATSTELSRMRKRGLVDSGYRLTMAGKKLAYGEAEEPKFSSPFPDEPDEKPKEKLKERLKTDRLKEKLKTAKDAPKAADEWQMNMKEEVHRLLAVYIKSIVQDLRRKYKAASKKHNDGIFSKASYNKIVMCLHSDNSASPETMREALRVFQDAKYSLLSEKDAPLPEPPTVEELLKLCCREEEKEEA